MRDAIRALAAELEAATWKTSEEVRKAFPKSDVTGNRLLVDLDGHHCAAVAFSYGKGVALIEFAGPCADWDAAAAARWKQRS